MGAMRNIFYACIVGLFAWMAVKLSTKDPFDPKIHVFGKNVIITGASSGIGRATALLACQMGANVFITARREKLLQEVIEKCTKQGRKDGKHGYLAADMGNMDQVKAVITKATEIQGGIDFLILNHGFAGNPVVYTYDEGELDRMKNLFDINFFSFVHMTNLAMPFLRKSQGKVATVSSIGGEMSGLFQAPYAATKFSISGFFGTIEHENFVKKTNVSFTVFIPGAIGTSMIGDFTGAYLKEGIDLDRSAMAAMAKPADPSECAYALLRSTSLRETKPYFPDTFMNRFTVIFGKLFPTLNKELLQWVAESGKITQ